MIQPSHGNTGDDHGASRSLRMTPPRFTAVRAITAKAIVIDTDAWVVLGLSGPHSSNDRAVMATTKPLIAHRMI